MKICTMIETFPISSETFRKSSRKKIKQISIKALEEFGYETWPETFVSRHCIVFLEKTLFSHSISLRSSVEMGTGKFNSGVGGRVTLRWTSI